MAVQCKQYAVSAGVLWAGLRMTLALLYYLQAVRKMMEAKKLESTLNYDSNFGDGNQKG